MKYLKILTLTMFFSCSDEPKTLDNSDIKSDTVNVPSAFCQDISTIKSSEHSNFPFSKTFIVAPTGYQIDKTIGRIYKDEENYLQVQESSGINFIARKHFYSRESMDSMGAQLINYCKIKINDYEAFKMSGFLKGNVNRKKTEIIFGDKNFTTLVFATYNNPKDESLIEKSLATLFFDNQHSDKSSETEPFVLNLAGTDFKLNNKLSNIFIYTIDGRGEPFNKDFFEPQFQVFQTPYLGDTTAIKDYFEKLLNGIEKNGVKTANVKVNRTFSHNKRWTYNVQKNISFQGRNGIMNLFVRADLEGNLVFLATSYVNLPKFNKDFDTIALSLDFK